MYSEYPDPEAYYPDNSVRKLLTCTDGWEYDQQDYKRTISTSFDWVCSKSDYATQALTANAVGSAVGAIVFGWAGDK